MIFLVPNGIIIISKTEVTIMKCYNCGEENLENAVFCKKCGRRLDGMAVCPSCGSLTPQDGEFCIVCGANRNAPVRPMPVKDDASDQGRAAVKVAADKAAAKGDGDWTKESAATAGRHSGVFVKTSHDRNDSGLPNASAAATGKHAGLFAKISLGCSAVTALLSLIFVFLIGCTFSVGVGGVSAGSPVGYGIFYFFGDAFTAAAAIEDAFAYNSAMAGAVIGAVCSALALLGAAVSFVGMVVKCVRFFQGKGQGKLTLVGNAAATYFIFLFGAALFCMCMSQMAEVASVSTGISVNGGTVAGIVLGAITLVAALVFNELSHAKPQSIMGYIVRASEKIVTTVFICVALALVGSGIVFVSAMETNFTFGINSALGQLATFSVAEEDNWPVTWLRNNLIILSAIAVLLIAAAGIMLAVAVGDSAENLGKAGKKRSRIFIVLSSVCLAATGIVMCIASSSYANVAGEAYAAVLGTPIVVIVFGALGAVVFVVLSLLGRKYGGGEPVETSLQTDGANRGNSGSKNVFVGRSNARETSSGWVCPVCGYDGNRGKFCENCGTQKVVPSIRDDSEWTCPNCGKTGLKGKFCSECGTMRPN